MKINWNAVVGMYLGTLIAYTIIFLATGFQNGEFDWKQWLLNLLVITFVYVILNYLIWKNSQRKYKNEGND